MQGVKIKKNRMVIICGKPIVIQESKKTEKQGFENAITKITESPGNNGIYNKLSKYGSAILVEEWRKMLQKYSSVAR